MELKAVFPDHGYITKTDLRNFYRVRVENFNEKLFRRILYALEKDQILIGIGAGIYSFKERGTNPKRKFSHPPTRELSRANHAVRKAFPYLDYLCWETNLLHEFMINQPRQNLIIIEAERGTSESVFNRLEGKYKSRIFLDPDRSTMENYIVRKTDPLIVIPLISRSPRMADNIIPFPKLEKILVDILVDAAIFFAFQGIELSNIYENAFAAYWVNERTMFRYAERRKAGVRLMTFIREKTMIQLVPYKETD